MIDPIVIDPSGFDCKKAWQGCSDEVDKCGGLTHKDGSVNWRAAFSADPGCCSCPHCAEYYWAWGKIQKCKKCDFEYPTDWWPMYSWGVQAHVGKKYGWFNEELHGTRMSHPYYKYGYENPVADPWAEHQKIPWKAIFSGLKIAEEDKK